MPTASKRRHRAQRARARGRADRAGRRRWLAAARREPRAGSSSARKAGRASFFSTRPILGHRTRHLRTAWPGAIVGSVRDPARWSGFAMRSRGAAGTANALTRLGRICARFTSSTPSRRDRGARRAPAKHLTPSRADRFRGHRAFARVFELGHVSEQVAAEEIVTGIFSRFCIGK